MEARRVEVYAYMPEGHDTTEIREHVVWKRKLLVKLMGAVMGNRKYQTRKASGISGEKAAKSDKTWLTPKRNHDAV